MQISGERRTWVALRIVLSVMITGLSLMAVALPTAVVGVTQLAPPPLNDDSPFGINGGLGIRYQNDSDRSAALQRLREAGVKWQREEFIWDALEKPQGTFHWEKTDSAVKMQRDAGINLLGLIDYGAPWWVLAGEPSGDKDVPSPITPQMIVEWENYVRAVVARYKDSIRHWEIWNEENIETFWKPEPNPVDYGQLLRAAYRVIKEEDPQAIVLIGGTSGVDVKFINEVIAANGGDRDFDVVNVHPYVWSKSDPASSPERRDLRTMIEPATEYGKPVWLTEMGWDTHPDSQMTDTIQARYLMRSYLISMATPGIEKIFWFTFRDGDTGIADDEFHGIVHHDLAPKEAFYAYQAMTRALEGAQYQQRVRWANYEGGNVTGDDVHEYRFARGDEVIVALWKSEGGDTTRAVAVDNLAASSAQLIHPGAGMAAPWTTSTVPVVNAQATVELNETPVFLTFRPEQDLPDPGTGETATVFLLDVSGSMFNQWEGGVKLESAKQAALGVLDMIEQESLAGGVTHQVSVATFSTDAWLDLPLTNDFAQARQIIQGLAPQEDTNMGAGLQVANGALQSTSGAEKIIILLSDGLTNTGMPPSEILAGPVQEAARAGTCIYTVGFGEPGDLDEDLLRRIAQAACGEYRYARTPYALETIYVRVRHESTGTIIDQFSGQVAQSASTEPHDVVVPPSQDEMRVTLNWPGSRLELALTDPQGRQVDVDDPGVSLESYARMLHLILRNPLEGVWKLAVYGAEVPEGTIDYSTTVSVWQSPIPPTPTSLPPTEIPPTPTDVPPTPTSSSPATDVPPTPKSSNPGLLVLMVLSASLALLALIIFVPRLGDGMPVAAVRVARNPKQWAGLGRGGLRIGRGPTCDLVLYDPQVSRLHTQIHWTSQGFLLEDLGSTNGTSVNGQAVARHYLHSEDVIRVGETDLIFWAKIG